MKRTILMILALMVSTTAFGARMPREQMMKMEENLNNAIIDASNRGDHRIGFTFSKKVETADIMELTDDIRKKGFKIDEETVLLNPRVIHVLFENIRQEAQGGR